MGVSIEERATVAELISAPSPLYRWNASSLAPRASRATHRRSQLGGFGPKEVISLSANVKWLLLSFFIIEADKEKKVLPSEPDVGDRAAVLENGLDCELVDFGLDVAHVDGGAQL